MSCRRYARRSTNESKTIPFSNSEEAWFWFVRCQRVRHEGARMDRMSAIARPCDPDDIYRAVKGLAKARRIGRRHLEALVEYGRREVSPDPRSVEEQVAARLWAEALDRLTTVLRRKGIVA